MSTRLGPTRFDTDRDDVFEPLLDKARFTGFGLVSVLCTHESKRVNEPPNRLYGSQTVFLHLTGRPLLFYLVIGSDVLFELG
jgi:hypothetical protein